MPACTNIAIHSKAPVIYAKLLVGGGTKKRQIKDIEAAHLAWKDYKRRKRQGE